MNDLISCKELEQNNFQQIELVVKCTTMCLMLLRIPVFKSKQFVQIQGKSVVLKI